MSIEQSITEVWFERVFNIGNYESIRIGLKATIGPDNPDVGKTLLGLDRAGQKYINTQYPDRIGASSTSTPSKSGFKK